ncbi:phospho-sugar mutase [Polycladomyces sp. WAk]|uniref:Phosphoglucomutase n=1 Tax=Polycladomyces zharkentensis TaxID=2807616 RepID=A0ABS2WKE3_9BACL|nr:phospho-sugar mutase [Polycladomyces sp. WAk]MBN2909936.1 phospho-sugar mutase [Polycladomyces sp. WAk]
MQAYERWMSFPDLDPALKVELEKCRHDEAEIEDRFYRHLTFGTAGLRGLIGAGTNRMNRYTVRRASEGFARFLLDQPGAPQKGVVIGYDSRHGSLDFARETAGVFAHHGIQVYLFDELCPTPMLSFTIRHLGAAGGVMITASHNPAEYNGYKVFAEDGGQISSDTAQRITRQIERVENELTVPCMPMEEAIETGRLHMMGDVIRSAYTSRLRALSLHPDLAKRMKTPLRLVFTPLHGTGNKPVRRILRELGYEYVHTVPEQEHPDPDFSTVTSPNPEDPRSFDMALAQARECDAHLVIGTDPDADRLGVWVRVRKGEYQPLNGNQIGALLLYYLLEQKKRQGSLPDNGAVIKSIVTSDLGRSIAQSYGVTMEETLTGFKYIAAKIAEYEKSGRHTFLFGYEESYGYLAGSFVRDKDAVQAAMLCCEMAAYHAERGKTLIDVLNGLYQRYGTYRDDLFSFTLKGKEGQETITRIMERLRGKPITHFGGLSVRKCQDYLKGIDGFPYADVLKYRLEDGSWVAVRPSGTEPKIKFYFSVVAEDAERAEQKLHLLQTSIRSLIRPITEKTK